MRDSDWLWACGGAGNALPGQGINIEIPVTRDGNGAAPANGILAGDLWIDWPFTILSCEMMTDVADTAAWDIWIKSPFTFGTAAPTVANSIVGGSPPALVAQQNRQMTGLAAAGWTVAFAKGSYIRWNQTAIGVATKYTLQLTVRRNG